MLQGRYLANRSHYFSAYMIRGMELVISFGLGCIIYTLFQKKLLSEYGILSEERLYLLSICDWKHNAYLYYLLEKRIPTIIIIYLISRERLGNYFMNVIILSAGFIMGLLFAECFIRYGLTGVVFGLAIGFPHSFFYLWGIDFLNKKDRYGNDRRKIMGTLIGYSMFMLAGVFLEIYCNPFLLHGLVDKILLM